MIEQIALKCHVRHLLARAELRKQEGAPFAEVNYVFYCGEDFGFDHNRTGNKQCYAVLYLIRIGLKFTNVIILTDTRRT